MDQTTVMRLKFRCLPELETIVPRPFPAVLGLPEWLKSMPHKAFNPSLGMETQTVKKCPSFIDAMTFGFLIPLAVDLEVHDGEFSWNSEFREGFAGGFSHSPIDFHDPSQINGTPFFDDDRYIIKFNSFWTIEAPPGYSILFTHPINRPDLPFTTLTGLIDSDMFHDIPMSFAARWNDPNFDGVLPKGTPVVQCLPVKRESWSGDFAALSTEETTRVLATKKALLREAGVYRRQFRVPKR
jgi:hypothetical protein